MKFGSWDGRGVPGQRRWTPHRHPSCSPQDGVQGGRSARGRRTSVKTQRALSEEQERLRIEGLRALARIIARRALADSRAPADATPGTRTHQAQCERICRGRSA